MTLLPSVHHLSEYRGTPRVCGTQYGRTQAEAIEAFLHLEVTPNPQRLRYAGRCWAKLGRWDPAVADFIRGIADGSGLSVQQLTLLLLHEEIYHAKPCTAVGATGPGTTDGHPIIGQNWDWNSHLYPWPTLTRLHTRGQPRQILYSYPGLWACAGINEHGLSLVWTGAGYLPKIKPIVGIPTYALIAGLLGLRTCADALARLRRTPIAGCFVFFLADARGEVWVIEALPGRFEAVRCPDIITRANHYECAAIARRARQDIWANPKANTGWRGPRMATLARQASGRIDRHTIETFLRDDAVGPGRDICQRPAGPDRRSMTIDSFYCLPHAREFWIARGDQSRHAYTPHRA